MELSVVLVVVVLEIGAASVGLMMSMMIAARSVMRAVTVAAVRMESVAVLETEAAGEQKSTTSALVLEGHVCRSAAGLAALA